MLVYIGVSYGGNCDPSGKVFHVSAEKWGDAELIKLAKSSGKN
jgi:hypothetical protein